MFAELFEIPRVFAFLSAAGIVGFFVRFLVMDFFRRKARKDAQHGFIRALYAEVDHNTKELELIDDKAFNEESLKELLQNEKFRPYLKYTPHTAIYKSNPDHLYRLDNTEIIQLVINMYSRFDNIIANCEGLLQENYKSLSVDGQYALIHYVFVESKECVVIGRKILALLEKRHGDLDLERFKET